MDPGVSAWSAADARRFFTSAHRAERASADTTGARQAPTDRTAPPEGARKTYRLGTHRTVAPAETLDRVRPLMTEMGITRIANITGLDRIGVPVVMVSRPNSRSISVSQGKGLDLAAAKASGLMESVETYHAEAITLPLKLGSHSQLAGTHPLIDVSGLPRPARSAYHDDEPLLWIEGQDLFTGSPLWVPYEVVHTDYTLPRGPAHGSFLANTNGLASGNHILEAVSHAIHEVIERDATTLWKHTRRRARRVLDLQTVDDDACRWVLERFEGAGLVVKVWDTTSDIGIASFNCLLIGAGDDGADPEFGAGCHPARGIALLRALTEAAQARTTYIAGSRDDFLAEDYTRAARARRWRDCRALLRTAGAMSDFRAVPTRDHDNLVDDVSSALERLGAVGIRQAVVVDLTKPELGLPVARVVIPGLESIDDSESGYVPGPRARTLRECSA